MYFDAIAKIVSDRTGCGIADVKLESTFSEIGIIAAGGICDAKRRIDTDKVSCDLDDYLSGKEEHANLFKGSYLSNYSWGENTLAELMGNMFY